MIRKGKRLVKTTWSEALRKVVIEMRKFAPEEVFFGTSGKITNEDNFVIQKFARLIVKTNNIDNCCARLCHTPTVAGFKDCLGIGASPGYLSDIEKLDCLLIIGSNPASNHPIAFNRILRMKKKGGKIINVTPIYSETAKLAADISLQIAPGTEVAFLNGLMNKIIEEGEYSKAAAKIEGFQSLIKTVKPYSLARVSQICHLDLGQLHKAIKVITASRSFGVMHGMGLTQHVNGIENVHSLVNLALLLNGKIVTGRGEINVQGGGDMLGNPLPLQFSSAVDINKLERRWSKELPKAKGMNLVEAIALGRAKMVFISAFNPAHSLPDLNRIHKNLRKIFLVQIESYFNLTSKFADIILPSPLLFERQGTITTGERRVRLVRQVIKPAGLAMPEWKIYGQIAKKLGDACLKYKGIKDITKEIKELINDYRKIDVEQLYAGRDQFASKEIKFRKFMPEKFEGADEIRSKKYPYILFTFRSRFSFLTDEMTGKSKTLRKLAAKDNRSFFVNPEDAKKEQLANGAKIKVVSSAGVAKGLVRISQEVPQGFIGAHFHSDKLLINRLFDLQFDEETFIPNFKVAAVNLKKLN